MADDETLCIRAFLALRGIGINIFFKPKENAHELDYGSLGFSPRPIYSSGEVEPTAIISGEEAQKLMDSLWEIGIRPKNAPKDAPSGAHLQDMRNIAFAALRVRGIEVEHSEEER